ncbi:MAG: hypothetical protein HC831_21635, partial [Chloroflexia bacterium]|nr:hypothetical protein [Chloroflexia bacterium]
LIETPVIIGSYKEGTTPICESHRIIVIDIKGSADLRKKISGNQLPDYIIFNEVKSNFTIGQNNLTSLKGAPRIVRGSFDCSFNKLTNLSDGPAKVSGDYFAERNPLALITKDNFKTSLKGTLYMD